MPKKIAAHHPHDKYFKAMMSMKRTAVELLQYALDTKTFAQLELETLRPATDSYIDQTLRESFSDVVYTCNLSDGAPIRLSFLFEHKSDKERENNKLPILGWQF